MIEKLISMAYTFREYLISQVDASRFSIKLEIIIYIGFVVYTDYWIHLIIVLEILGYIVWYYLGRDRKIDKKAKKWKNRGLF